MAGTVNKQLDVFMSIRELARIVDRNPPEVLENVNELADYSLV